MCTTYIHTLASTIMRYSRHRGQRRSSKTPNVTQCLSRYQRALLSLCTLDRGRYRIHSLKSCLARANFGFLIANAASVIITPFHPQHTRI